MNLAFCFYLSSLNQKPAAITRRKKFYFPTIGNTDALGAGIKLPTGDYRYQDYFWKNDTTKTLGPVDQSIQLGDGGTGFSTEYNAFYSINKNWVLYTNGYYLFNPREQNGVSTARGSAPSATAIAYGSDVMSVPDQFMFRSGANFLTNNLLLSLGMRIEGVPAEDLIGGSNGFRRPRLCNFRRTCSGI